MSHYFSQVTVIGVGLLGGSLSLALKKYDLAAKIIGISRSQTIEKSLSLNVIDDGVTYEELQKGISGSEVLFLTTPVSVIIDLLEQLAPIVEDGVIITDVGSAKRAIMESASRLFTGHKYFIGGHPMAGAEQSGVEKANADLYKNRPYVLIPASNVAESATDRLEYAIKCLGARTIRMNADVHDEIVAAISHVPQLAAVALMNSVGNKDGESGKFFQLAGGGFRDTTRIASSPFSIWEDICETNKDNIREFLQEYIERLQEIKELIGTPELAEKFRTSARFRHFLNSKFPID